VFIGAEVRLDVGFNVAQARLANLAHGGLLSHASDDAYGRWGAELAQVGPLGATPGMSRLVKVQFRDTVIHEDSAVMALRWEATGTTGGLFPVLDADITLTPAGDQASVLVMRGAYRPPLGQPGSETEPGGHAHDRRGDDPGLRDADRGCHRLPSRLTRGAAHRDRGRQLSLARDRYNLGQILCRKVPVGCQNCAAGRDRGFRRPARIR
jgi:hypothetical protein